MQETYGRFTGSLLPASGAINREFRKLWRSQPRRRLPFRYGYMSQSQPHLLVTPEGGAVGEPLHPAVGESELPRGHSGSRLTGGEKCAVNQRDSRGNESASAYTRG